MIRLRFGAVGNFHPANVIDSDGSIGSMMEFEKKKEEEKIFSSVR